MAGKYTEAQAKATRKYQSKTVTIQIRVTEEKREQIRKAAAENGKSLQAYLIQIIDERL